MVCSNVLFETLKTWVNLNLPGCYVVKLSIFKYVGWCTWITGMLLGPEVSSDAKVCIMASSYNHLSCVSDARNGVGSNFCC